MVFHVIMVYETGYETGAREDARTFIREYRPEMERGEFDLSLVKYEEGALRVPSFKGEPCIYLADSARLVITLLSGNYPTAAWRHKGNEGEKFRGVSYVVEEPGMLEVDSYVKIYQRLVGEPWEILTTERFLIREMKEDDLEDLYRIYADPESAKYLPPLDPDPVKECETLRDYIKHVYSLYGYGYWAVVERATGRLIGRAGFGITQQDEPFATCGYVIAPDKRGQGCAREVMAAILQYGHEILGFDRIGARTHENNLPSRRLLESLGMHLVKMEEDRSHADPGNDQNITDSGTGENAPDPGTEGNADSSVIVQNAQDRGQICLYTDGPAEAAVSV